MEDDPEITRHRENAGHSIQMLRAVVDGATYESVALQFGISRTAVERRIKSIAVQLTQEVGVDGLKEEGAAFDLGSYRGVTPGLRIWTGTTIERQDLVDLLPWLDWAYAAVKAGKTA